MEVLLQSRPEVRPNIKKKSILKILRFRNLTLRKRRCTDSEAQILKCSVGLSYYEDETLTFSCRE